MKEWEQSTWIRQLKIITDFDIYEFLDLTESGEMPPYAVFQGNNIGRHAMPNGGVLV